MTCLRRRWTWWTIRRDRMAAVNRNSLRPRAAFPSGADGIGVRAASRCVAGSRTPCSKPQTAARGGRDTHAQDAQRGSPDPRARGSSSRPGPVGLLGGPLHPSAMTRTVVQTAASAQCQPRAASPRGGEGPVRPLTTRLPARTPRTPAAGAADARAQARRPQPGRTGQWPRARGGGAGQRWSPWRVPQSTAYTTDTYRPFSKYGRIRGPGRGGWGEGPSENLGDSQPPTPAVQARTTASLPQSSRTLVTQTVGGCLLSYDVTSGSDSERREAQ